MKQTLVLGANGFVGSTLLEDARRRGTPGFVGGVSSTASAARAASIGLPLRISNVLDLDSLRKSFEGVHTVVNCTVGSSAVIERGADLVAQACLDAGVQRLLHLSTTDVYGDADGSVDESRPLTADATGYGEAKRAAERRFERLRADGVEVVMLRPPIVVGPHCIPWSTNLARRLAIRHSVLLSGSYDGTCNYLYVADLVRAIRLVLDRGGMSGTFNVNGASRPTWSEFFHRFAAALHIPHPPPRQIAGFSLGNGMRRAVRKPAKRILVAFPNLMRIHPLVWRVFHAGNTASMNRVDEEELRMFQRKVSYDDAQFRRSFGYSPTVDLNRGLEATADWMRNAGWPHGGTSD